MLLFPQLILRVLEDRLYLPMQLKINDNKRIMVAFRDMQSYYLSTKSVNAAKNRKLLPFKFIIAINVIYISQSVSIIYTTCNEVSPRALSITVTQFLKNFTYVIFWYIYIVLYKDSIICLHPILFNGVFSSFETISLNSLSPTFLFRSIFFFLRICLLLSTQRL